MSTCRAGRNINICTVSDTLPFCFFFFSVPDNVFKSVLYWSNLRPVSKSQNRNSRISIHAADILSDILLGPGAGGDGQSTVL